MTPFKNRPIVRLLFPSEKEWLYKFLTWSYRAVKLISLLQEDLVACMLQSFAGLSDKPLMVDLTVEEGQRLKVIYGSSRGFHAIDLDTSNVFDIYIPAHVCFHVLHFLLASIEIFFSFCTSGIFKDEDLENVNFIMIYCLLEI